MATSAMAALGRNDLRSVRRDSLLVGVALGPLLYVAIVRFPVPPLTDYLARAYGFDLVPYYPAIVSFFLVLGSPVLIGAIASLLMLEERDAGTLAALRVTPLPLRTYAGYRAATAAAVTVAYVMITVPLSGLVPVALLLPLVPVALVAGLFADVLALGMAAFARNKIEGLAIMRAIGLLVLGVPLIPYFIDSSWELAFGVVPSYWPAKAFWVAADGGNVWPYVLVGAAYNLALLALLLRRFTRT